jgi:hypothetical protein
MVNTLNLNLSHLKDRIRHLGWLKLMAIVMLTWGMVGLAAAGAGRMFDDQANMDHIVPTNTPFVLSSLSLPSIGAKAPRPAIERLMEAAERLAKETSVPYVYGGNRIGNAKQCQACSDCARRRQRPADATLSRYNKCAACRRCGIDCSNFVNALFAEAGLKFRFADTRTLNSTGHDFLREQFGFINIGNNLDEARTGDLIVEKGHVMMVISVDAKSRTIDYIHSSRGSRGRKPIGGIELRRGKPLDEVQKRTLRILRHRELVLPDDLDMLLGSRPSMWNGLRQMFAANN